MPNNPTIEKRIEEAAHELKHKYGKYLGHVRMPEFQKDVVTLYHQLLQGDCCHYMQEEVSHPPEPIGEWENGFYQKVSAGEFTSSKNPVVIDWDKIVEHFRSFLHAERERLAEGVKKFSDYWVDDGYGGKDSFISKEDVLTLLETPKD